MPIAKSHLAIVIPVYNEAKVIRALINSLPARLPGINKITVLAVNDGSTDSSLTEIEKTRAIPIDHPINLGAGAATITGLQAAIEIGCNIAVTLDGDGQHDPQDISKLIKPVLNNKADLVIGSRLKIAKGMPWIKRFGNWGLNLITFAMSQMWTTDSQSGFKCFSRKAIERMDVQGLGYEFCSEIIVEAKKHGLRFAEVPIKTIYTDYSKKKGQSIFNGTNIVVKLILRKLTKTI